MEIPYTNISNFEYTSPVAHHLGVLPLIVVSLILPREHKHFFSMRYKDSFDVVQSVVFEVPKHDPLTLLEVLRGRAPQACVVQKLRCGIGNEPY